MLPGDKGAAVDRSGRDPHHQPGRDALLQKDIQSPDLRLLLWLG